MHTPLILYQAAGKSYALDTLEGLMDFLEDADIRFLRSEFLTQWQKEGKRLPRRQEAEHQWPGCLVPHDEMRTRIQTLKRDLDVTGGEDFPSHAALRNNCLNIPRVVSHVWEAKQRGLVPRFGGVRVVGLCGQDGGSYP